MHFQEIFILLIYAFQTNCILLNETKRVKTMKTSQEETHYLQLYVKESMYILLKQVNSEYKTTLICDV